MEFELIDCNNLNLQFKEAVSYSKEMLALNGGLMRLKESCESSEQVTYAPHLLFPCSVPRKTFNSLKTIQPIFQKLIQAVSMDKEFMKDSLSHILETDTFTQKLWAIYEELCNQKEPRIHIAITRNDFLLSKNGGESTSVGAFQVEYNMTAVSFGPLCSKLSEVVRANMQNSFGINGSNHIFPSDPHVNIASALIEASKIYNRTYDVEKSAVLIIADRPSTNCFDQRWIEFEVNRQAPHIKTLRKTYDELLEVLDMESVRGSDRIVRVNKNEIGVIYARTGYDEGQYLNENEWELRRLLELSRCPSTPSIPHQLANYKKIQQVLCLPGVLERFGLTAEECQLMRASFVDQYACDLSEAGDAACELARVNPDQFVMKPQKEGGAHNYYGEDIIAQLDKLGRTPRRSEFILMKKINFPTFPNIAVSRAIPEPKVDRFSAEIGIFGVFIVDTDGTFALNSEAGHLARAKESHLDETGVVAGFGKLATVWLTD